MTRTQKTPIIGRHKLTLSIAVEAAENLRRLAEAAACSQGELVEKWIGREMKKGARREEVA